MARPAVGRDYTTYVRNSRPVFYLPMQGGVMREVVRDVTATLSSPAPTYVNGPFAGANGYGLTASNDYIEIATDTTYHPGDTFSAGGWMTKLADTANFPSILGAATAGDFGLNTPNTTVALGKVNTANVFVVTRTLTGTGWHHIVFIKNAGTSAACYIDGVSQSGTFTNNTIVAGTNPIRLGVGPVSTATDDLNAAMCHMAIWNRVLTDGEIRGLYLAGVS